jgi:TolA-binding protein
MRDTRAWLLVALALAGCATRGDVEAVRRDLDRHRLQLAADVAAARQASARLRALMERATALLKRNNADVGAQVERLEQRIARLEGKQDELRHELEVERRARSTLSASVDARFEAADRASGGHTPRDADGLFRLAASKIDLGDYLEARRLLRHFIETFSSDGRVTAAQVLLGDTYFAEQKFAAAIVEYRKVLEKPGHNKAAPEVAYKIGMSFYQLKYCSDALLFLKRFVRQQPGHARAASARKIVGLIGRYRRSPGFCKQ